MAARPRRAAGRHALALTGAERGVGGEDDDARALAVLERHEVGDLASDRHAVHAQAVAHAEVGQRQHAQGPAATVRADEAGRGADARLEVVARHAGAGPDAAFGHGAGDCAVERGPHVLLLDVHAAQVVEEAVVALTDDGHDGVLHAGERLALHDPADGRVVDRAGALRVAQQDRRLDEPPLAHGADADDLADAVGGVRAGDDALVPEVAAVGEDRGDARAGGPAA